MPRRVLAFVPQNPRPPRSGAHRRALELLAGVRDLGYSVSVVGSDLFSETRWDAAALADIGPVFAHRPSPLDFALTGARMLPHRLRGTAPGLASRAYTPPGLVRTFRRAVEQVDPDVLLMNYAHWDRLLDPARDAGRFRVIDTVDMVTVQARLRAALDRDFPLRTVIDPAAVPDAALRDDFYAGLDLEPSAAECAVYDRYDATLVISAAEAETLRRRTTRTQVGYVPMSQPVPAVANTYSGRPVFAAGYNPFNLQGYCYLVRRVLPRVLRARPDAVVNVFGPLTNHVRPAPGVELLGYVPDLAAEYAAARFAVGPVFGGTGQQVKIVEAMAHGLAVVALRPAAERSPLRHRETGLVAATAEEFAGHVLELWADPGLCRRLGGAAREVVAAEYNRDRLMQDLAAIL
jgi:hypothetical protein